MYAQNDLNLRILRMFEGTFSLEAAQIILQANSEGRDQIYRSCDVRIFPEYPFLSVAVLSGRIAVIGLNSV